MLIKLAKNNKVLTKKEYYELVMVDYYRSNCRMAGR